MISRRLICGFMVSTTLALCGPSAFGTILVIARHGGSVWIAANGNQSQYNAQSRDVSVGESCKIFPFVSPNNAQLIAAHAGITVFSPFNVEKPVLDALDPTRPLMEERNTAISKIKSVYDDIATRASGRDLKPLTAQTYILISWREGAEVEFLGFDQANMVEHGKFKYLPAFDFPFPPKGDFVYVHDGENNRTSFDKWPPREKDPKHYLMGLIKGYADRNPQKWGGYISIVAVTKAKGFTWMSESETCKAAERKH